MRKTTQLTKTSLFFLLLALFLAACDEGDDDPPVVEVCVDLYEPDIVLPNDNEIAPDPELGAGSFSAIPNDTVLQQGTSALAIDLESGIISPSNSISGIKYYITFTAGNGELICEDSIIISGIDYLDGEVNLDPEDSGANLIEPILDADPGQAAPQGEYDIDGEATANGLVINRETGVIDLLGTVRELQIEEGQEQSFTFRYTFENDQLNGERVTSEQTLLIYWFPGEFGSDESEELYNRLLDLLESKQQLPRNGRTMSPPPIIIVRGEY
jgi:hypothetical protein